MRRLLFLIVCVVPLVACDERGAQDAGVATERPDTGGTLVIAIPNEPDAVNSLVSGERYGQEINRNLLYLPLLTYGKNLELEPVLAESWELHGDTAVTFRLRRDVFWHDGAHTTAYDVAFTFERGRDPRTGYPNADYWIGWHDAQVLDSFTIRFRMDVQPEPLANFSWIPIMPQHLLGGIAPEEIRNAPFNQQPVGNGPFKFVEHRPNDRWVFEANRDFPASLGGRPYVDRVVLRIIPEPPAQQTELRTQRVHMITQVSTREFAALDSAPNFRGVQMPYRQYAFLAWNTKRPPFDDARFRRALGYAIDRREIVQVVRGNYGEAAVGPVPSFHWSYDEAIGPLPFSLDSSRALLQELGMRDVNNDRFVERPNGRPLRIELKYGASSETQRDIAEMVRADLEQAGIRVVLRPLEFNTLLSDVTTPQRDFDATIMGFEVDPKLVFHDMFHSRALENPYQFASYRNAQVDSILDQLNRTTSREQAIPLWQRLQTVIRDEQPWTFLYNYAELLVVNEQLKGPQGDVRGVLAGIEKWWIDRPETATP